MSEKRFTLDVPNVEGWEERTLNPFSHVYPRDLIRELHEWGCEDSLVEFVKALDEQVASWDFTMKLYKYFKGQKKILKAEEERLSVRR